VAEENFEKLIFRNRKQNQYTLFFSRQIEQHILVLAILPPHPVAALKNNLY